MFRSLRSRLFLTYLLVIGLVLVIISISLIFFILRFSQQVEYGRLNFWLSNFTGSEARALISLPEDKLQANLERIDNVSSARSIVLGPGGDIVGDSRPDEKPLPSYVIREMATSGPTSRGSFRYAPSDQWLYVSSLLAGRYKLILTTPKPTLSSMPVWGRDLLTPVMEAGVVSLLLSVILAWGIAYWVASPLGHMAKAADGVSAGDYDQQLPLGGPDEVRSLAETFNAMVRRVQDSQQAQRDFVANVSHELKTPLTSIQGFAQAILDGTAHNAEEQHRAAQVIYDESDRLRRLVEELLDLARIDAGQVSFERQPLDLGALLEGVVERLSVRAVEEGVRIESRLPELPALIGDGDRLAQVFTNLIDNAVKHTSEGADVILQGEVEGGWVSIHVDDSGPGIPPDDLSRIFERFYQLDKARAGGRERGVGLGLAISREIVQAHGGRLVAQSVLGRGSRFTVQLPIIRPDDTTMVRKPS
ncbi:MAG: HAMP domain-containing histidine kinase [Anaerolineaceae bacterium]|nr:MAG: HAMP domain-containing histidine kinase [Anaerolineaceae bacterium]